MFQVDATLFLVCFLLCETKEVGRRGNPISLPDQNACSGHFQGFCLLVFHPFKKLASYKMKISFLRGGGK